MGKPKGPCSDQGPQVRGMAGNGMTTRESLMMPRQRNFPGRDAVPGRQGQCRCDAAGGGRGVFAAVWTPPSPGYRGRPSPAVSHACGTWKPRQGPVRRAPVSRPQGEPNSLAGTGCPRSEGRQPKGSGKPGRDDRSSRRPFPDNWPDTRPCAWLRKQADVWQVSL
jgi:hypothetical protein